MKKEHIVDHHNLIGKMNQETKDSVKEYLENRRDWKKQPGEYEKSPEIKTIISETKEFLQELGYSFGISIDFIPDEAIHLLPSEKYEQSLSFEIPDDLNTDYVAVACYNPMRRAIYANADYIEKVMLRYPHEIIHASIHHKFFIDERERKIIDYRNGYEITFEPITREPVRHFVDLNEALISFLIFRFCDWLQSKNPNLYKKLKLEREKKYFLKDKTNIDKLFETIARKNGESEEETANRFCKGLFTGEMMHLRRDIEANFGKGAIREFARNYQYPISL